MSEVMRNGPCSEEWLIAFSLVECSQHNVSNHLVFLILQMREIHKTIHSEIDMTMMQIQWARCGGHCRRVWHALKTGLSLKL